MPHVIDHSQRAQDVLGAAHHLLAERGPTGLTLRALAAGTGISLGSLTSHFDSKARLLHLMAQLSGVQWIDDLERRSGLRGVAGFLPTDTGEVETTRTQLSWEELARSTPELRGSVLGVREDEVALLREALEGEVDRDGLDIVLAAIHGLRQAVCSTSDPMPVERAQVVLQILLRRLGVDGYRPEAASAFARSSATIRSGSSAE